MSVSRRRFMKACVGVAAALTVHVPVSQKPRYRYSSVCRHPVFDERCSIGRLGDFSFTPALVRNYDPVFAGSLVRGPNVTWFGESDGI